MKTLLERLKPEIKKTLLDEQEQYPNTVGELLKVLEEEVAVTELTLKNINNLSDFSSTRVNTILEIYDMFESL
jgi:hypothetical protein